MNPVNATTLYVSVCRMMVRCDPRDPQTLVELFNVLPFFRDSLSCLACGNLLQDPIAPTNSTCQHYVCKGCRGKKMLLKPSCSWCKDYEQFEENKQLSILVDCYRNMCEYIAEFFSAEPIISSVKGSPEVMRMLQEALEINEEQEGASVSKEPALMSLFPPPIPDGLDVSVMTEPHQYSADKNQSDSSKVSGDRPSLSNLEDVVTELVLVKPETVPVCQSSIVGEVYTDTIANCVLNGQTIKEKDCVPIVLSVQEVLDPVSDSISQNRPNTQLLNQKEQGSHPKTLTVPSQLSSHPQNSGSLASSHPQQPSTGITCQAVAHRKVRLSRKRSRSESDSEMVQPLPLTSLIQGPPVAATVPPKVACEPNPPVQPMPVIPNGDILKVKKALLDSSENIRKSIDQDNKKVPAKSSKAAASKPKAKTKSRVLSGALIPGHPTKAVHKKSQEKRGCKCGRATQNPSVLTCRGQRCPCYSNRKACLDCICRGCQNSYMANGEKKLEAFAVPEKALEQTRLTLGINVTSISVRNAGPNVLGLSTGSPMASFLDTNPHEDQSFEDALEMQFDC